MPSRDPAAVENARFAESPRRATSVPSAPGKCDREPAPGRGSDPAPSFHGQGCSESRAIAGRSGGKIATPPGRTAEASPAFSRATPSRPPKAGQVSRRDQGDDGDVRLDHRRQGRHLAGGADARFDHGVIVLGRIQPGQGQGHSDVIVEIALVARTGFIRRSLGGDLPLAQEQSQQVLGRSLARAAGDPDHRPWPNARRCAARDGLEMPSAGRPRPAGADRARRPAPRPARRRRPRPRPPPRKAWPSRLPVFRATNIWPAGIWRVSVAKPVDRHPGGTCVQRPPVQRARSSGGKTGIG